MTVPLTELEKKLMFTAPLRKLTIVRLDKSFSGNPDDVLELRVRMINASLRLHPELPPTDLWTYEGEYPGPVFVVRRGQRVRVEWINDLKGALPVEVVSCGNAARDSNLVSPQNEPGSTDGNGPSKPDRRAAALPPWTVVHLHGGRTAADSDGWTENAFLPRDRMTSSQQSLYTNDQQATMLWYHDHGMGITRLNVYAGLAGGWIIRDDVEDALALPSGNFELALVIQDKNLETDKTGLTGQLLHKVETDFDKITDNSFTGELFAPFTLVNGTIWPHHRVKPKPYRIRLLNGSNARTYELFLLREDGSVANDLIQQIGSDGGLLPAAVNVSSLTFEDGKTAKGLILAPAERVDLIIDFQRAPGEKLTWYNVAAAPFDNQFADKDSAKPGVSDPITPGQSSNKNRLRFPQVMQFRVEKGDKQPATKLKRPLVPGLKHWSHKSRELKGHHHVWIALNERNQQNNSDPTKRITDMLFFNELQDITDGQMASMSVGSHGQMSKSSDCKPTTFTIDELQEDGKTTVKKKFANCPASFYDAIKIQLHYGKPAVWNILNLSADSHPIHLHLVQFQVLARAHYDFDISTVVDPATGLLKDGSALRNPTPIPVDKTEFGWKDTVRVNPGELVSIAAIFEGYTGRYMYHCHILEHEDMEMMRPYIVMPEEAMAFMPPM